MKKNLIEVLIVEDDSRIAEIHQRFIERIDGFSVIGIATNYQEAVDLIEILKPQLVLLDVYFPDMNGLDFLQWMKKNSILADVIMITASKEIDSVNKALHYGVFDFIIKPVIFDRFKKSLIRYVNYSNKVQSLQSKSAYLTQEEIDGLIGKNNSVIEEQSIYPKGIDKLTLDKVLFVINEVHNGMTAENIGLEIGVSRTTARRYLEYLVSEGKVLADLAYGTIGRPERVYLIKN
ncbi:MULTISPECIES: response regulator [unclassified Bacillus (in: firmicutes)]|uniref:response regulator n=1 Tax=unclassified Bacillus (in: firmicutes) TaxID=185979 RepID=UPI0008E0A99B|nr:MULTISPECIES: response regulator [unclassified Bacillus (in: firmicutes)]PGZ93153.1 two-component system response regulator [Bacillus sp. AFS029533]SFD35081.1 two-component system, CitB family, response regulator [Bacillus sp. UNCCL81]